MQRWNVYPDGDEKIYRTCICLVRHTVLVYGWHLGEPVLEPYLNEDEERKPETLQKVLVLLSALSGFCSKERRL